MIDVVKLNKIVRKKRIYVEDGKIYNGYMKQIGANKPSPDYLDIQLGGMLLRQHKLIYYLATKDIRAFDRAYHIHHKDLNKLNNRIDNLQLMTVQEHTSYHGSNPNREKRLTR